jgi:uncharacterized protein YjbI with pentapeptide repeats
MKKAQFHRAILGGAVFHDCDLRLADFTGCQEFEDIVDGWLTDVPARGLSFRQLDMVREGGGHA